jgi:hypothetical protein
MRAGPAGGLEQKVDGTVSSASNPWTRMPMNVLLSFQACVADRSKEYLSAQQHQQVDGDGTSDDLTKQVIMATEPFKDRGGIKPRRKTWKSGFDNVVFSPEQEH